MMMKPLTHRIANDEGFSLVEMLVVSVLLAIILGAAFMAQQVVTTSSDRIMARNAAQNTGQQALERMARELRQARVVYDADEQPHTLNQTTNTGTSISFWADIDHDGYTEQVTYSITAAGLLQRTVARTTKLNNPLYGVDWGTPSAPTTLAKMTAGTSNLFAAYTAADPPVVTTDPTTTRAIQITMNAVDKSGADTVTVNFPPTIVSVRAFGTGYQP
jgi:prepilin-type N-terminal cleavage/methylation domain-containing protein